MTWMRSICTMVVILIIIFLASSMAFAENGAYTTYKADDDGFDTFLLSRTPAPGKSVRMQIENTDNTYNARNFVCLDLKTVGWLSYTPLYDFSLGQMCQYSPLYTNSYYAGYLKISADSEGLILRAMNPYGEMRFLIGEGGMPDGERMVLTRDRLRLNSGVGINSQDLKAPSGQTYYVCINDQGRIFSQPGPCN